MAEDNMQVVPITQLDQHGVIKDNPPVSLPANVFSDARNVRFKDGAVRKMEGEVDIFPSMKGFLNSADIGELKYIAWWPNPNQTIRDAGYYIVVAENTDTNISHDIYAILPAADSDDTDTYHMIGSKYSRQGNWQHTLFNGGFTFVINNGLDKPQYITDPSGNIDVKELELNDLPGWDSYNVNSLILDDVFDADIHSRIFDTGQLRIDGVSNYIVEIYDSDEFEPKLLRTLTEDTEDPLDSDKYMVTVENGQNVLTLGSTAITDNERLRVRFRSDSPVGVRAAIVRAFGDFLVAGNLVEYKLDEDNNRTDTEVRRLTGVVRSSNVATPGTIPNSWDPFAVGASTADEFVIADTGTVQDLVPLQGNMYLYTNSSISVMRLTGNTSVPLAVTPVTDQYGALTTDAVLEYDGKHFVIGSDDIYLFGGHPGSIQSIADQKLRRDFLNLINPINENTVNLFTLRYAARDEIWVCFPSVNSVRGESDLAYIWNYRTGTWTIRDLISVIKGDIGPVPGGGVPSAIVTFGGMSGTDGYSQIGSYEVQTIDVDATASVGHTEAEQPEIQTFSTLDTIGANPRPALNSNTPEILDLRIDTDFFAGPLTDQETYTIEFPDENFTYDEDLDNGGALLSGTTNDGAYTISANDLYESKPEIMASGSGLGTTSDIGGRGVDVTVTNNAGGGETFSGNQNTPAGTSSTDGYVFDGVSTTATTFNVNQTNAANNFSTSDETIPASTNTVNTAFNGQFSAGTLSNIQTSSNLAAQGIGFNPGIFFSTTDIVNTLGVTDEQLRTMANNPSGFITSGDIEVYFASLSSHNSNQPFNFSVGAISFSQGNPISGTNARYQWRASCQLFYNSSVTTGFYINFRLNTTNTSAGARLSWHITGAGNNNIFQVQEGNYTIVSNNGTDDSAQTQHSVVRGLRFRMSGSVTATNVVAAVPRTGFTNNSGSTVSSFAVPGSTALTTTTVANGATAIATGSAAFTNWSGTVTGIRFSNTNSTGAISFTHDTSDGSDSETTTIDSDDPAVVVRNTSGTWEYDGNRERNDVTITQASTGYNPITTADSTSTFSYSGSGSGNQTVNASPTGVGLGSVTANVSSGTRTETNSVTEAVSLNGASVNWANLSAGNAGSVPAFIRYTQGGFSGDAAQTSVVASIVTGNGVSSNNISSAVYGSNISDAYFIGTVQSNGHGFGNLTLTNPGFRTIAENGGANTYTHNGNLIRCCNTRTNTNAVWETHTTGNAFPERITAHLRTATGTLGSTLQFGGSYTRTDNNPPIIQSSAVFSGSGTLYYPGYTTTTTTTINTRTLSSGTNNTPYQINFVWAGANQTVAAGATFSAAQVDSTNSAWSYSGTANQTTFTNNADTTGLFNSPFNIINFNGGNTSTATLNSGGSITRPTRLTSWTGTDNRLLTNNTTLTATNNGDTDIISFSFTEDVTPDQTPSSTGISSNFRVGEIQTYTYDGLVGDNVSWNLFGVIDSDGQVENGTALNYSDFVSKARSYVNSGVITDGLQRWQSRANSDPHVLEIEYDTEGVATLSATLTETNDSAAALVAVTNTIDGVGPQVGREPIDYQFLMQDTDNNDIVNVAIDTIVAGDTDNQGAMNTIYDALRYDTEFHKYFDIQKLDDEANILDTDTETFFEFRISARAIQGDTDWGDSDSEYPTHGPVQFISTHTEFGGNDGLVTLRTAGVADTETPLVVTLRSGTQSYTNGQIDTDSPAEVNTTFSIPGSFTSSSADGNRLNEQFRQVFNTHNTYLDYWTITKGDSENPASITVQGDTDGPRFHRVEVGEHSSNFSADYFNFQQDQLGVKLPDMITYPTIQVSLPGGTTQIIELNPANREGTDDGSKLDNNDIAYIIRNQFTDTDNWIVQQTTDTDSDWGTGLGGNQIKFAHTEYRDFGDAEASIIVTTLGNTGATFPTDSEENEDSDFGFLTTNQFSNDYNSIDTNEQFRGGTPLRTEPTRIMIQITNPDFEGGIQYIPVVVGNNSTYNPTDHSGINGTRVDADTIASTVESAIINNNRRLNVNLEGNQLTMLPVQYSELANFVLRFIVNDDTEGVSDYNTAVEAMTPAQRLHYFGDSEGGIIDTNNPKTLGVQTVAPTVAGPLDSQNNLDSLRRPDRENRIDSDVTDLATFNTVIDTEFDPLRPWPTSQVNLNKEYPIFANSILDIETGELTQSLRGGDIGFLYDTEKYESYVERIELPLAPEFNTETIQSIALHADGGTRNTFGGPINQAKLDLITYGTNNPGETGGLFDTENKNVKSNDFQIGSDYKIDIRTQGRFINYRISDRNTPTDTDGDNEYGRSWNLSGMQVDVTRRGTR